MNSAGLRLTDLTLLALSSQAPAHWRRGATQRQLIGSAWFPKALRVLQQSSAHQIVAPSSALTNLAAPSTDVNDFHLCCLALTDETIMTRGGVAVPPSLAAVKRWLLTHPATELRAAVVWHDMNGLVIARQRLDEALHHASVGDVATTVLLEGALSCPCSTDAVAQTPHVAEETARLLAMGCDCVLWDDSTGTANGKTVETLLKVACATGVDLRRVGLCLRKTVTAPDCIVRAVEFGVAQYAMCNVSSADVEPILSGRDLLNTVVMASGLQPEDDFVVDALSLAEEFASIGAAFEASTSRPQPQTAGATKPTITTPPH